MIDKDDVQKWEVVILGIMMCGGIDFLDEIIKHDNILAECYEYERMKGD